MSSVSAAPVIDDVLVMSFVLGPWAGSGDQSVCWKVVKENAKHRSSFTKISSPSVRHRGQALVDPSHAPRTDTLPDYKNAWQKI